MQNPAISEVEDSLDDILGCASVILGEFHQSVDLQTLDIGIALHRTALSLWDPSSIHRFQSLFELSSSLLIRFHRSGEIQNLEESIALLRQLLDIRPNRILCLVAALLVTEPHRSLTASQLSEAYRLTRKSLQSGNEAFNFCRSGKESWKAFRESGNLSSLRDAVSAFEQCETLLSWGDVGRAEALTLLAQTRLDLFIQTGSIDAGELDTIIELHCEAIKVIPDSAPDRGALFSHLGKTFHRRFTQYGAATDLHKSITALRVAVNLKRAVDADCSSILTSLGFARHELFEISGDESDLDAAVAFHREALTSQREDLARPDNRAASLNNLGRALLERFLHRGSTSDLDAAISIHSDALNMRAVPHPSRSVSLHNLAHCFNERFLHMSDTKALDSAILLQREAVALRPPGHLDRVASLSNLANSLQSRFDHASDISDLHEAVQLHRECLDLRKSPHLDRNASLHNLAICLGKLSENIGDITHLEDSIELLDEALTLLHAPHPERASALFTLAQHLLCKYRDSGFKDSACLQRAFIAFREASIYKHCSLTRRFMISRQWCMRADEINHSSALEAYSTTIALLPQFAMLGLDLESRRQALASISDGLARSGAECAIRLNELPKAIEFLEAGRSVFWSQALQLRTPLHDLKSVHPDLGEKVSNLFQKLEHASYRDIRSVQKFPPEAKEHMVFEAEAKHYRKLNSDLLDILEDVRHHSGFENFLRPQAFPILKHAARNGPVVILNISKLACTAVIVSPVQDGLSDAGGKKEFSSGTVSLSDMTHGLAMFLVHLLRENPRATSQVSKFVAEYLPRTGIQSTYQTRLIGELEHSEIFTTDKIFQIVLSTLWTSVVEPIFGALKLKKSANNPPRLWWCPTGLLSFLPIHAAGTYSTEGTNCASDYVISSYTPTLAALLDPPAHIILPFKMTAIIQPETPNLRPLPFTRVELSEIESQVPGKWLTSLGRASDTTVKVARAHLRESAVMHFACHGTQDFANPLESGLRLSDGLLKVSQIMQKFDDGNSSTVSRTSLAFLNACETARGDDGMPDEAMHLAASLLFTGFRGVIATMWTIADPDGPKVARTFYGELFRTCNAYSDPPVLPNVTKAAYALHRAIVKLREEPGISFARWIPFVHYGL
ncbi:CHAT domain-containing protein [Mycena venus]|uniref:CHAT domain-containing protein n=1 Tax=Mycena venus TaxID=2733690 RepID=A0A8H6YQM1_9AGAR|nr:CHAT domain-containing protein [Mycena venus]